MLPMLHRVGREGDEQLLMRRRGAKREAIAKVSNHPLDPQPPSHYPSLSRQRSIYLIDAMLALCLIHFPTHPFDLLDAMPACCLACSQTHPFDLLDLLNLLNTFPALPLSQSPVKPRSNSRATHRRHAPASCLI